MKPSSKRCYRCSKAKPASDFSTEAGYSRDGLWHSCIDCVRKHLPHLFREDGTKMTYIEYCEENGIKNTRLTKAIKARNNQ